MSSPAGILGTVPEDRIREFVASQRWFGAKNREIADLVVLDEIDLAHGSGSLVSSLLEVRFSGGTHDVYQLLARPGSSDDLKAALDVFGEPAAVARLIELAAGDAIVPSHAGAVEFSSLGRLAVADRGGGSPTRCRAVELVRRRRRRADRQALPPARAGHQPRARAPPVLRPHRVPERPRALRLVDYSGTPMTATLGIAQRFLAGARDGWELGARSFQPARARSSPLSGVSGRWSGQCTAPSRATGTTPPSHPKPRARRRSGC